MAGALEMLSETHPAQARDLAVREPCVGVRPPCAASSSRAVVRCSVTHDPSTVPRAAEVGHARYHPQPRMSCTTPRISRPFGCLLLAGLALAPTSAQERRVDAELAAVLHRLEAMERELDGIARQLAAEKGGATTDAAARLAAYAAHERMRAESPWQQPRWQFLGPTNISGRVTDVAVGTPRGSTYTMFVAGASGAVWKTENEGVTWKPVFEHAASTSIGDVTIAPSNQDVVWIGTG